MASEFWVVEMLARSREISTFIPPGGLLDGLMMPFELNYAPQIYQRLIYNEVYGYLKSGTGPAMIASESSDLTDVFTDGEPDSDMKASVLGRRSYMDAILIPAKSWESLYRKVKRLLDVCNRSNLYTRLAKGF